MLEFTGKRAFITGGTRGIGLATAELLVRSGARVALGYHSRRADADAAVAKLGPAAVALAGDLGVPAAARTVVEDAVRSLGGLDIVVVNHGVWPPQEVSLAQMTDAQWESTRRANYDAAFYVCRAAIPHLPAGGKIVLVSSTAGQRGEAFHADYGAARGGIIAFTKSLAVELAPGINVNCVAPGWVDTEMARIPYEREGGKGRREIEAGIPLKRVASAMDVAGPIVFLCSDLARHITGEILNVNGGSVLCG